MLYFIIVFLAVTCFLLFISKNSRSVKLLILMLLSFTGAIVAFMLYLGKDNYYYNIIYKYFGISRNLWDVFIFSPFRQEPIIRMINVCCMLFIYSSLCFAISFLPFLSERLRSKLPFILAAIPLLQVLIYDPVLYKEAYMMLYPDFLSTSAINKLNGFIYILTKSLNCGYLAAGLIILAYCYVKAPSVRLIKSHAFFVLISYLSVVLAYSYVMLWAPSLLIRVSKVAKMVFYKSVPLGSNTFLYNLFPYFLVAVFSSIAFATYRYTLLQTRIRSENIGISREIDAAAVTSRVFCHYMKNELYAIQAEIEDALERLHDAPEISEVLNSISERCRNVYARLDDIHSSTKNARLNLHNMPVAEPVQRALSELDDLVKRIRVNVDMPSPCPHALLDLQYFSQVIANIVINAVEAMKDIPPEEKQIDIAIKTHNQWVIISVRDRGTGIAPENLKRIFTPFYSTKSTAKNWGMGLALCHKIIMAHDGKISVESHVGKGTTFNILLPLITSPRLQTIHKNLRGG